MSDTRLSITVDAALRTRLEGLALETGQGLEALLRQAVEEFVDNWEDYAHSVSALQVGEEERVVLRVVNQ